MECCSVAVRSTQGRSDWSVLLLFGPGAVQPALAGTCVRPWIMDCGTAYIVIQMLIEITLHM